MPRPERDRALGCMVGLAVCEALARSPLTAISFDTPLPEGLWGDGTAMALNLAESLVEHDGIDQRDQMIRYTSWFRYGYLSSTETCESIDEMVKQATLRFERTWNPEDQDAAQGDVCLARVAPVAIFFAPSLEGTLDACAASTRTTHAGRQSLDACRLLAAMIHEALLSLDQSTVLGPTLPADLCPEVAGLRDGGPADPRFAACVALKAAVEALGRSRNFADGCVLCHAAGPRALAVYGQLAGAWYGRDAIPSSWRDSLAHFEILERLTDRLLRN